MAFKGKMMFIMAVCLVLPLSLLGKTLQSQDKTKRDSPHDENILSQCYKKYAEDLIAEESSSDSGESRICMPLQVCKLDCSWTF